MLIQTSSSPAVCFDSYDSDHAPLLEGALPSAGDEWGQWLPLVARIRADEPKAVEELYSILYRSMRPMMIRRIGLPEADDRFHDTVLIVMGAIRLDSLHDPARLMGYVRTVANRQVGASIREAIDRTRTTDDQWFHLRSGSDDPEEEFSRNEGKQFAQRMLDSLSCRNREIIVRFYVEEQSAAEICAAMELTETQFRLLKWRAKAQLTTRCRGKLSRDKHLDREGKSFQ